MATANLVNAFRARRDTCGAAPTAGSILSISRPLVNCEEQPDTFIFTTAAAALNATSVTLEMGSAFGSGATVPVGTSTILVAGTTLYFGPTPASVLTATKKVIVSATTVIVLGTPTVVPCEELATALLVTDVSETFGLQKLQNVNSLNVQNQDQTSDTSIVDDFEGQNIKTGLQRMIPIQFFLKASDAAVWQTIFTTGTQPIYVYTSAFLNPGYLVFGYSQIHNLSINNQALQVAQASAEIKFLKSGMTTLRQYTQTTLTLARAAGMGYTTANWDEAAKLSGFNV